MLSKTIMSGDWKNEKHVPHIHIEKNTKGEPVEVRVVIGEDDPHPNTLEHHIGWIKLFFQPEGFPKPIEVSNLDFMGHGEGETTTIFEAKTKFVTEKPGTLYAMSYCNIHGLWEDTAELVLE